MSIRKTIQTVQQSEIVCTEVLLIEVRNANNKDSTVCIWGNKTVCDELK